MRGSKADCTLPKVDCVLKFVERVEKPVTVPAGEIAPVKLG